MIYKFSKPMEEAVKDYLQGIEKAYNKAVIIENMMTCKLETDNYIIRLYVSIGNTKQTLKITEREAM